MCGSLTRPRTVARSTGTLFVDRARKSDLSRVMELVEGLLRSGSGVVVFPEGSVAAIETTVVPTGKLVPEVWLIVNDATPHAKKDAVATRKAKAMDESALTVWRFYVSFRKDGKNTKINRSQNKSLDSAHQLGQAEVDRQS